LFKLGGCTAGGQEGGRYEVETLSQCDDLRGGQGTGERFATGKWRAARFIVFTDKGLRKSISTHKGCAPVEAYGNSW
jgi:hypothetical protein